VDLTHGAVSERLGLDAGYSASVERWISSIL
jgi:hypothetical protein